MTYATTQNLLDRVGEAMLISLTDRATPATGEVAESVAAAAIADADAAIDGYLKGRYALPLASTPPLVRDLSVAIAIYKLHRNVASDKVRSDYEDAFRQLREIAAGTIRLDVAGVEPASSGATGVRVNDRPRDMTPDNLKGVL